MNVIITFEQPTYDTGIKVDGVLLECGSITKNEYDKLKKLRKGADLNDIYNFVGIILNKNTAGIPIPQEEVDKLDFLTIKSILAGYTSFLGGYSSDPN